MTSSSSNEVVLQPGRVVNDKWKVINQLGKGGFGAVYKVVNPDASKNPECVMKIESIKDEEESMIKMEVRVTGPFRRVP